MILGLATAASHVAVHLLNANSSEGASAFLLSGSRRQVCSRLGFGPRGGIHRCPAAFLQNLPNLSLVGGWCVAEDNDAEAKTRSMRLGTTLR